MSTNLARPPMHDQFVLSREERSVPDDFVRSGGNGWHLATSPSLPVTVLTSGGVEVGWILGWAILADGRFSFESSPLELPLTHDFDDGFEEALYAMSGRWTCLVIVDGVLRCYVDPSASLGTVFSSDAGTIASTTSLVNWGDPSQFSEERFAARTLARNQYFINGLTSDQRIGRVIPNHYLDTAVWATSRHWPKAPLRRMRDSEIAGAIEIMASSTSETMAALTSHATVVMPLTSGRDSRMLMSTVRKQIDQCEFITFEYRDFRKSDGKYAQAITRRFGLSHRMLAIPVPTDDDRRTYLEAVGYDANEGKARDFYLAATALPRDRGWVTGYVGEVGRGYFWRDSDRPDEIPSVQEMLKRMRLPQTPEYTEALEKWLADVPYVDTQQLLDLLYLENRQGAWASTQLYGAAPFVFSVIPLNTRSNISTMLRLPVDYVRSMRMPRAVATIGWPELAKLPYDRQPGVIGYVEHRAFVARRELGRLYRRITKTNSR